MSAGLRSLIQSPLARSRSILGRLADLADLAGRDHVSSRLVSGAVTRQHRDYLRLAWQRWYCAFALAFVIVGMATEITWLAGLGATGTAQVWSMQSAGTTEIPLRGQGDLSLERSPRSISGDMSDQDSEIRLRKIFVPVDQLTEFMRGRERYLPLSAAKFNEMLEAVENERNADDAIRPLYHLLTVAPSGLVQGYSVLSTVRPEDSNSRELLSDSSDDSWVSFDKWSVPADFFNLVPVYPGGQTMGTLEANGMGGRWTEQPLSMSVNENGVFGGRRSEIAPFVVARYSLTLPAASEGSLRRRLKLPNRSDAITLVRGPQAWPANLGINGTLKPISQVPTVGQETLDSMSWQVVSPDSTLYLERTEAEGPPTEAVTRGHYFELGTLAVSGASQKYTSVLGIEFPRALDGDLVLEVPADLDVQLCEVNGEPQQVQLGPVQGNLRQLRMPWRRWEVSNAIRLQGTLPLPSSSRLSMPRITVVGHQWLQGTLQVSLESPVRLIDYELVDCRLVSCQSLGATQSLTFHRGGPESSVTLLTDAREGGLGSDANNPPPLFMLSVDDGRFVAEQWIWCDLRYRVSNQIRLPLYEGWQIEQIVWANEPPQATGTETRVDEVAVTSANWFVAETDGQRIAWLTLPDDLKQGQWVLRLRATRPMQEGETRITSSVVKSQGLTTQRRWRRQWIGIKDPTQLRLATAAQEAWRSVPVEDLRLELGPWKSVASAGSFWTGTAESNVDVVTEQDPTRGLNAQLYVGLFAHESGVVEQWQQWRIEPLGPITELQWTATQPGIEVWDWAFEDDRGQTLEVTVEKNNQGDRWTATFAKSIAVPIQVRFSQRWIADREGQVPILELNSTGSLVGIAETVAAGTSIVRLRASVSPAETVYDESVNRFRLQSRADWFQSTGQAWIAGDSAANKSSDQEGVAGVNETIPQLVPGASTITVFEQIRSLRYELRTRRNEAQQPIVRGIQQVDTWCVDHWRSELIWEVEANTPTRLEWAPPDGFLPTLVTIDGRPTAINEDREKLSVSLPQPGLYSVVWSGKSVPEQLNASRYFSWRYPPKSLVPPAWEAKLRRSLAVPVDWGIRISSPRRTSNADGQSQIPETVDWWSEGQALARRLVSPILWPHRIETPDQMGNRVAESVGLEVTAPREWQRWRLPEGIPPTSLQLVDLSVERTWHGVLWSLGFFGVVIWQASLAGFPLVRGRVLWWLAGGVLLLLVWLPETWCAWLSTAWLGGLMGLSWYALLAYCSQRPQREIDRLGLGADETAFHAAKGSSRFGWRVLTTSGLVWLAVAFGWWSAHRPIALAQSEERLVSTSPREVTPREVAQREPFERTRQDEVVTNRLASVRPSVDETPAYDDVVIPVDSDRRPLDSVVYLTGPFYQKMVAMLGQSRASRHLELRAAQHLLEYDARLNRFATLTSQFTCRATVANTYRIPWTAGNGDSIRQVRVDGLPVLHQRQGDYVLIYLDDATHLVSITYDLQSPAAVFSLNTVGVADSFLVLSGVPSTSYVTVSDREGPGDQIRSLTQRRFRMDRLSRLKVAVEAELRPSLPPAWETWLTFASDRIECRTRFLPQRLAGLRGVFHFQVDSRLQRPLLRAAEQPGVGLSLVANADRDERWLPGPVYRLTLPADWSEDDWVEIEWDYQGRAYGQVIPPWLLCLDEELEDVQQWHVFDVAPTLVYLAVDVSDSRYRRASEFEVPSLKLDAVTGISNGRAGSGVDGDISDSRVPAGGLFVYETRAGDRRSTGQVVGRLGRQPAQMIGNINQNIQLGDAVATLELSGDLKVSQGEITQLRLHLPNDTELLQWSISGAQPNELAWFSRRPLEKGQEWIALLRTPATQSVRVNASFQVPLVNEKAPLSLPWARFRSSPEITQTLRVQNVGSGDWKLQSERMADIITAEFVQQLRSEQDSEDEAGKFLATLLVTSESEAEVENWKIMRTAGPQDWDGQVIYELRTDERESWLSGQFQLNSRSAPAEALELRCPSGMEPPAIRHATTGPQQVPVAFGPWEPSADGYRLRFADPVFDLDLELAIPVQPTDRDVTLPSIPGSDRLRVYAWEKPRGTWEFQPANASMELNPSELGRLLERLGESRQRYEGNGVWRRLNVNSRGWGRLVTAEGRGELPVVRVVSDRYYLRHYAPLASNLRHRASATSADDTLVGPQDRFMLIHGVQQWVLRALGRTELQLQLPSGLQVQQVWVDQRPATVLADDGPNVESGNNLWIAIDPTHEYCVLTLSVQQIWPETQPLPMATILEATPTTSRLVMNQALGPLWTGDWKPEWLSQPLGPESSPFDSTALIRILERIESDLGTEANRSDGAETNEEAVRIDRMGRSEALGILTPRADRFGSSGSVAAAEVNPAGPQIASDGLAATVAPSRWSETPSPSGDEPVANRSVTEELGWTPTVRKTADESVDDCVCAWEALKRDLADDTEGTAGPDARLTVEQWRWTARDVQVDARNRGNLLIKTTVSVVVLLGWWGLARLTRRQSLAHVAVAIACLGLAALAHLAESTEVMAAPLLVLGLSYLLISGTRASFFRRFA